MKRQVLLIALFSIISAHVWADASKPLNFTAVNGPATVTLYKYGTPPSINLLYSTDSCVTWSTYTIGDVINLSNDSTVYFKALNTNDSISRSVNDYYSFGMTGVVSADGNVMSLLDETMSQTSVPAYAFYGLFDYSKSLVHAPELPATQLSSNCYKSMFTDCSSLTQAPALPADSLADSCYAYMFADCKSLTQTPALHATTLANYCYCNMFYGCTSLTQASALPATTLANYCYCDMFYGCTSLLQAPALPATTLANNCYNRMFYACASLTQAPALPATTLDSNCYAGMFQECSSLRQAPALPATTLADYCYTSMFQNCRSLTQASVLPATTLAKYCYSCMYYGCTSLTKAPALHATTLADACYSAMFYGCSSLLRPPSLPASSLPSFCYYRMFSGCTSMVVNQQGPGMRWVIPATNMNGGSLTDMFTGTGGTMSGTPSADTTYYILPDVEYVDTTEADIYYYCNNVVGSTPVTEFHLILYKAGGHDTADVYFANDTSLVMNRLPRVVEIVDSVTGSTTTITITIGYSAFNSNLYEVTVHMENQGAGSSYLLDIMALGASGMELDDYMCYLVTTVPGAEELNFTAINGSATIKISTVGTPPTINLRYSTDSCVTWSTYTIGDVINLSSGSVVYFKALKTNGSLSESVYNYYKFVMTGVVSADGNIMSLLDATMNQTSVPAYAFNHLFHNCTSLVQVPELPAVTLANGCYLSMFEGCTSLVHAPGLPATSLPKNCYHSMFKNCTSMIVNRQGTGKKWVVKATDVDVSSLTDMLKGTGGTMSGTPSANTTYYLTPYVEYVDTSGTDIYFHCNKVIGSIAVNEFHLILYKVGSPDTADIYFRKDTSFVMNRLQRIVKTVDSATGPTTNVVITTKEDASNTSRYKVTIHIENLDAGSTYYLSIMAIGANGNELDDYVCYLVTEAPVVTGVEESDARDEHFFPTENTDVYLVSGHYVGKYNPALQPGVYIMRENNHWYKFAKSR